MKLKACCIFIVFFSVRFSFAQSWQSVGGGANDQLQCVFGDTVNNVLYATGLFDTIGGVSANHIAKWDGSSWLPMGSGSFQITASYHPMEMYNGNLVFMGTIFHPSNMNIAKWNGASWDSIGNNFGDGCRGIKVLNNELYAYGEFDTINGTYYNSIAKWNGTDWVSVGFPYTLGLSTPVVISLAMYHGELYAGGIFNDTSPWVTESIAKFDGTSWSIVGGGIHGNADAITDLEVYKDELYIAGDFRTSSGNLSNAILRWDGNTLRDVNGGITTNAYHGRIDDLIVYDNKLFATGYFDQMGGVPANYFASWDGTNWCGYGSTDYSEPFSLATINNELYLANGLGLANDTVFSIAKSIGVPVADTCGNLSIGITEQEQIADFEIYPNPASENISIKFNSNEIKNVSIEIKNILGQTVSRITNLSAGQNNIEVNISDFAKGLYIVQLNAGNKIFSKKVIKQ